MTCPCGREPDPGIRSGGGCYCATAEYPEHDKQHAIIEESQAIGLFLDHGLPKMGLALYQRIVRPCEADHKRCENSRWHTKEELATIPNPGSRESDGRVQITEWRETYRSIQSILAEYFDIDLDRLDDEKRAMLKAMRRDG